MHDVSVPRSSLEKMPARTSGGQVKMGVLPLVGGVSYGGFVSGSAKWSRGEMRSFISPGVDDDPSLDDEVDS